MKEKICSLFLAFVLVLGLLPTTGLAAETPAPFSASAGDAALTITKSDTNYTYTDYDNTEYTVPLYVVRVPSDAKSATLDFGTDTRIAYAYSDSTSSSYQGDCSGSDSGYESYGQVGLTTATIPEAYFSCYVHVQTPYNDSWSSTFLYAVAFVTDAESGNGENKDRSVRDYASLMNGIAAAYTSSTDAWTTLDMAAYGKNIKADGYSNSSAAPTALAEAALGQTPNLSALSSFDVTGAYAIYSAPYVLLAYDAAEADDTEFLTKRSDLKAALVTYLNALDPNDADTDEVTPILAALGPYYNRDDTSLDTAVANAITWLSDRQNQDGTFSYYGTSNANTTAFVIVALSALGIDAHTDSRFVKDKSAVEGLFSFALSSMDGFGYKGNVTKNDLATEQGFRALVAYARFVENGKLAYNNKKSTYNIYLDADVNAAFPADPQISATVSTQPPDSGNHDGTITVSFSLTGDKFHYNKDTQTYTSSHTNPTWISRTSVTVPAGSTVKDVTHLMLDNAEMEYVTDGAYISEINGLAEFDNGPDSGWMYRHNGLIADESYADRVLEDGDTVRWFYADDYLAETNYEGNWDSINKAIRDQRAADKVIDLIDAIGEVTQDSGDAIKAARKAYDALTDDQQELVTNYDVLVAAEATYAKLIAPLPFIDVAEDFWAYDAIKWAYENGYMSGKTDTTFEPGSSVSRQQVWMILARHSGEEPANMADAKAWAVVNGISDGTHPGNAVTRQQLVALLYRYATLMGYDVDDRADLTVYPDAGAVAGYAQDAMAWSVANGIVGGTTVGTLNPWGNATRAQFAAILYRFCEKMDNP